MKPLRPTDQKRLHRSWRQRTDGRLALVLDNVQTPYNVGTIVRLAAAFKVEHLFLAGATSSPSHPGARKTALGTERLVPMSDHRLAVDAIAAARADGFFVVGVELAGDAVPLFDVDLSQADGVCLIVGHEDRGLTPQCLDACDAVTYIPTPGRVGSLNVATATAIALYEVRRREWQAQ